MMLWKSVRGNGACKRDVWGSSSYTSKGIKIGCRDVSAGGMDRSWYCYATGVRYCTITRSVCNSMKSRKRCHNLRLAHERSSNWSI